MAANSQKIEITGTVVDATDNLPIIGAEVVEKYTANGTITDINGNYTIIADPGGILVFSAIAFITKEEEIKGRRVIDVALERDQGLFSPTENTQSNWLFQRRQVESSLQNTSR